MISPALNPLRKVPLRLLLILPFVVQISAAVGLVGYFSFRNGQKSINDLADQLMAKTMSLVSHHLDAYIETPPQLVQANLDAIELGTLNLQDFQTTGHLFWKQVHASDSISYTGYALKAGGFAGAGKFLKNHGITIDEISARTGGDNFTYATDAAGNRLQIVKRYTPEEWNPLTDPWYTQAVKTGGPSWGEPYIWPEDPIISVPFSRPIYNKQNQFVGALYAEVFLSSISDFLQDLQISPRGKLFVIERNGALIASSTSKPYMVIKGKAQRLNALDSQDSTIQAVTNQIKAEFGDLNAIQSYQKRQFQIQGDRQFVQIAPWYDPFGLDWLVVVAVPESDFMSQIHANNRSTFLLCLAALGMAVVGGILTARRITRPILDLNQASQALAAGQLDQRVDIQEVAELEVLGQAFNHMADQIQVSFNSLEQANQELEQLNEELEQRVEVRTSELKTAKEDAEAARNLADSANQAKSDFLANMSHELRTPLTGIMGYTQILQRSETLLPGDRKGIEVIDQCSSHLLTLINDILDLSKIEARKFNLHPSEINFSTFLLGIVEMCCIKAESKGIDFNYQFDSQLPASVVVDEQRLRQILINLLSNAIKFTDKGSVTLSVQLLESKTAKEQSSSIEARSLALPPQIKYGSTSTPIHKIHFQVEDTGMGVAPEHLDRIFLPFEQAGNPTKQTEGTGLGLAISSRIVALMGSHLEVQSQPGKGSLFWFDVDLLEAEGWSKTPHDRDRDKITGYQGARQRILVVDNRWETRSILVNLLEPLGFDVIEAMTEREGLQKAYDSMPNLIILDMLRPLTDDFEFLQQIRQSPQLKDIAVIVSSASVFETDQTQILAAGASAFSPKPIQARELLGLLKECLNLEWVYEKVDQVYQTNSAHGSALQATTVLNQGIIPPSNQDLELLHDLILQGAVREILQHLDQLELQDGNLIPFIQQLRQSVQKFQVKQGREFLEQYLQQKA